VSRAAIVMFYIRSILGIVSTERNK